MKTQKTLIVLLFTIVFAVAISSCKKNNDKQATCRIVTVTESSSSGNTIRNITYNNDGKISTLNASGSNPTNKVFNYNGNTVIVNTTTGSGTFSSRDSITLDNRGRPLNLRQYYNVAGTNFSNYKFEYSGDDLLKLQQTDETGGVPETTTTTYVNGNMVSLHSPSGTTTLEYFTDKKVQPGDYLELAALIQYGMSVYPHKNLLKTIASGASSITNFNYEMNPDGTISKVTATSGSSVSTLTYQYQCN
jgi:hypothetical protein